MKRNMLLEMGAGPAAEIPWAMQMKGASTEEPQWLARLLTGAIAGCGGWVLRRETGASGTIRLLFEFERRSCLDVYAVLMAAGVELSPAGHRRLTELCQCTRSRMRSCGSEIASVELEVQTLAATVAALAERG